MQFKQPPVLHNAQGHFRTIGFELEYANVNIDDSVQAIVQLFGGTVEKENRFRQHVIGSEIGNFTVEFDLQLLSEKRYKKLFENFDLHLEEIKLGDSTLEEEVETVLESIVGRIFPNEIACPPLPFSELHKLEKLREALVALHAEGTEALITNAFGTHINTEAPDLEPATLLNYVRAVVLLYPWLLEAGNTNLARRMSPFIDPYPDEYENLILSAWYNPDLDTLISDYHAHNPNRNRPLDLYPIFAMLKPGLTSQLPNIGKVNPRCTFHYRLPNCSISRPGWTLAEEWNHWVMVEELAGDPERIKEWSDAFLVLKDNTFLGFQSKWATKIAQWLSSGT